MRTIVFTLFLFVLYARGVDDRFGIATGDPHPDPFHFGVASGWNQIATTGAGWDFPNPWDIAGYSSACAWLAKTYGGTLVNAIEVLWFPFGWIANYQCDPEEIVDWNALDPRLPYYALKRLFEPNGLFACVVAVPTLPTLSSHDPTYLPTRAKGYVF